MENVRILLKSVSPDTRSHVIQELAHQLSIDEETSQSIIEHAPIVLFDQLSYEVGLSVRKKLKKLVALGAKIVLTDDDSLEEYPRVNWPEGELPEIIQLALEELEKEKEDTAPTTPPKGNVLATFSCPSCGESFAILQPTKEETEVKTKERESPKEEKALEQKVLEQEEEELKALEQEEAEPKEEKEQKKGKKITNLTIQESSLELEGLDFEEPLPSLLESEENSNEKEEVSPSLDLEEKDADDSEGSVVELEPEEEVISFDSKLEEPSEEDLALAAQQMSFSPEATLNLEAVDDEMPVEGVQSLSLEEESSKDSSAALTSPSSTSSPLDATLNLEAVDENIEGVQSFSLDEKVDLESLAPPPLREEISETDLSVLDSDDSFQAVEEEIPSEEVKLDQMFQEAKGKGAQKDSKRVKAKPQKELEPLSPEEALHLIQNPTGLLEEKKERKPKFQKLTTTKRTKRIKIREGTGPHGVVLSPITSEEKRALAAKIIAEIKNIPLSEAKKLTKQGSVPVLQGVNREVADVVSKKFKRAGISVRITTKKS